MIRWKDGEIDRVFPNVGLFFDDGVQKRGFAKVILSDDGSIIYINDNSANLLRIEGEDIQILGASLMPFGGARDGSTVYAASVSFARNDNDNFLDVGSKVLKWENDEFTEFVDLGGDIRPEKVTPDGSAILASNEDAFGGALDEELYPYLWTEATGVQSIASLSGFNSGDSGFDLALPTDISDDGSIIIGRSFTDTGEPSSYLWTKSDGLVSFDTVHDSGSQISQINANAMTPDGTTVFGQAFDSINFNAFKLELSLIDIEIITSKDDYVVGEKFNITVQVTSKDPNPVQISFLDESLLTLKNEFQLPLIKVTDPEDLDEVEPVPLPEPFSLTPQDNTKSFFARAEILAGGKIQLGSRISANSSDGVTEYTAIKDINDAALQVTFKTTPKPLLLNEPDLEGNEPSDRCKVLQDAETGEDDPAINDPVTNCVEITATIKNAGLTTFENVNVLGLASGPHKGLRITSLDGGSVGVPLILIEREPPAGTPEAPVEEPEAFDLAPGESKKFTWRLEAFDGPAKLRLRVLVTGSDNGETIRRLAEGEYRIISNVLAEIRIKPVRIGARVLNKNDALQGLAGFAVHIGGTIKNVSDEETLEIEIQEVITGNAGHGIMYSRDRWTSNRTPGTRQPFQLVPGEEIGLTSILRTLRAITATDAKAKYFVKAFSLKTNEDGSVTKTDVSDQVLFIDDEDGFMNPISVRMLPNAPAEFDPIDECGSWYFSCGVVLGVENLARGLWDTSKFLGNTLIDFGNQELMLLSWAGEMTVVGMKAILGDEVARNALVSEIAVDLQALIDTGAITFGQGVSASVAIEQAMEDGVGAFGEAITSGDLDRVQFQFGRFLGENPDLLPFNRLVMKMATSKVMSRVSGVNGASKITGDAIEELAKKSDDIVEVSARYDAGLRQGKDITREVAETGDLVAKIELDATGKPKLDVKGKPIGNAGPVPKFWGASSDDVLKAIAIAVDENVLISFRSRAIEAITLVKNKLAWPKPAAYGVKGTTEIDLKYLSYPKNRLRPDGSIDPRFPTTKGTTDLVEPPSQLIGKKKGPELEAALDLYMDNVMKQRHPELATDIQLAGQVRNRLKTRAEEWPKYLEKFEDWKVNGVDLSFGANKQGIWEIFSKPVVDNRKIRLTERTINTPDGNRKVFQFDMSASNGTDFRAITGDIDFLAILNANGTMLLNPIKRLRIYKKLQTALGMQHGESFTFALRQDLRAAWLRCCTRGVIDAGKQAEKMITAQPNGKARVSEFVENKSIVVDSRNASKRLDKSGDWILLSGAEYALKARQGLVNRLKFRDLSDSITDIIGFGARVVSLTILRRIIPGLNDENEPTQFNRDSDTTIVIPDRKGGLLAWIPGIGFELVPPDALEGNVGALQQSIQAVVINPPNTGGIELFGNDGRLKLLPQTSLTTAISAGSATIDIASMEEMGAESNSPWFELGDSIVINPGGINQEIRKLATFGSLVFTEPLAFSHQAGELISVALDPDNDGETNITDVFPNDPDEAFDTDGDGIGNNADLDDDNDGISDFDELRFSSDPLNSADTPEQHRPVKPVVSSLTPDTDKPLTHFDLGITAFSDPDEVGTAASIEVMIEGPLDAGEGIIFLRQMQATLPVLEFPAATLDVGTNYTMSVRYMDASGQPSDASDVFAFVTEAVNPDDLNNNRIEDSAEVTAEMDINNNGVDDVSEGITVILNGENGDALGISADKGLLSDVSVLTKSDIPAAMIPAEVDELPIGMTGFRVSGLTPGDEVTVTFTPLSALPANADWYQFDSLSKSLVDISQQAIFNGDGTVNVKYIDGGIGDLDGVANGRIVDPSGPVIQTVTTKVPNEESNGGGGGGVSNLFVLLLLALGIYLLRMHYIGSRFERT
jgi:hypothetical protein